MIRVVADANALMMPFQFSINIDAELSRILGDCEIIVPKPIVGELERLSETKHEARAALKLAKSRKIVPIKSSGDDAVLELAEQESAYIITNDVALIKRARASRIKIIRLKESSRLAIDGGWLE